jgi:hypothetical protein
MNANNVQKGSRLRLLVCEGWLDKETWKREQEKPQETETERERERERD